MKDLSITQFGNPILRLSARQLKKEEMTSVVTQQLIQQMRRRLESEQLGVGLAAPQVGQSLALAVVCIRPLPHRPAVTPVDLVLINPTITAHGKRTTPLWEGCISSGIKAAGLFAQVPRYQKVTVSYYDEHAEHQTQEFSGLSAHVIQHEVDHLNGVLFVDRVKDPKTYMTYAEYKKMAAQRQAAKAKKSA